MRIVSEGEFSKAIKDKLSGIDCDCVTGPGRSGAIASVYASHILKIPFLPYGTKVPKNFKKLLIIDTATESGATLRKSERKYKNEAELTIVAVYHEPPRVAFWYESTKPQRYSHEKKYIFNQ